jgi:hypothetical protein
VQQAPHALYITLLGPLLHGRGALGLAAALENLALLLALAVLLRHPLPWRRVDADVLLAVLSFVVLMALVIGWTTPVMGAMVRYRTPLLPFLFVAALLVCDHRKLLARWPKLKPLISA